MSDNPYHVLGTTIPPLLGRQRLFETLTRYELWQEMIELCHTVYLEPTSDEGEQVVRLRHLGRAYFRTGDTTNGQAVAAQIHEQVEKLKAERDKAQATAERRSMNQQILFLLEESLRATDKTAQSDTARTTAPPIDTGGLVDQDGPT